MLKAPVELVKLQSHGLRFASGIQYGAAGNSRGINDIRAELVFRQVPGKSAQRDGQTQRFRRLRLGVALLNAVGDGVIRIGGPPPGLGLLPPRRLALRLAARLLTRPHSHMRSEPPAADRAGSLAGLGHGELSSPPWPCRRDSVQPAWVIPGKQRWETSRERRRTDYSLPPVCFAGAAGVRLDSRLSVCAAVIWADGTPNSFHVLDWALAPPPSWLHIAAVSLQS